MKKWLAGVIGVIIILGWFAPFWFKGKIPTAIDIPTAMYYPWLNYNYGYEVRPPVKNPLLTDTISQFWIWRNWAAEGLKNGVVRMWNPYSFSGYAQSAWFQTILFSPLNIFYWLTDTLGAMGLIVIAQVLIGLIAGYSLGKKWFENELSAVFLAVAWTTGSYFIGWLTWGTVSLGLAVMPLGLLYIDKLAKGGQKWATVALCLAGIVLILSGHPQTIGYMGLVWLGWAIIVSKNTEKKKIFWKNIMITAVAVMGITAIAWWPSMGIIRDSSRMQDRQLAEVNYGFASPMRVILKTLAVNFYGNPGTNNYWGGGYNFQEELVNFGSVGVIMLLVFVVIKRKKRLSDYERLGVISIVSGLLLSFKYPLGWLVYSLQIPLWSTSPAGRGLILVTIGGVILATAGFDKLIKGEIERKEWRRWAGITAAIILGVGLGLGYSWVGIKSPEVIIAIRNFGMSAGWMTGSIILAGVGIFNKKTRKITGAGIIMLLLAENYLFFKKYTPFVERKLYFPETKVTKFLKEEGKKEFFRVERESAEVLPPNMWQIYWLYSTSGYDPINPRSYSDYLKARGIGPGYGRYIENGTKDLDKIVDDLAVKYWLVLKRDKEGKIDANGTVPIWVDKNKWSEVMAEGPVAVLENKTFGGVVRWSEAGNTGPINLLKYEGNYWRIETASERPDRLVLAENMANGWKATVDGKEVGIQTENKIFKAVEVPSGNHLIEFVYKPKAWTEARMISVISLLLATGWWLGENRAKTVKLG